ncbi:MAG: hypothetical protein JNL82_34810 [Myxococcales bacterium]|nr:hypothetical protein [Myxococcales bacterium]
MKPALPETISAWPLAARLVDIGAMSNAWFLVVVAEGTDEHSATELHEEIVGLTDHRIDRIHVSTAEELITTCAENSEDILVLTGLSTFDEHAWRAVDVNRSRLERVAPTLLIINSTAVHRMPILAPNLWSWIGDGVWRYGAEDRLTSSVREQRLAELRRHFGFDDAELEERARAGRLPAEPDIAEWLVLLGLGELIPPSLRKVVAFTDKPPEGRAKQPVR